MCPSGVGEAAAALRQEDTLSTSGMEEDVATAAKWNIEQSGGLGLPGELEKGQKPIHSLEKAVEQKKKMMN